MGIEPAEENVRRINLSPRHLRLVRELLRTHLPGVAVWAYGSRVRGNARPYSDLDLVAFTSPEHKTRLNVLRQAFEGKRPALPRGPVRVARNTRVIPPAD